MSGKVVGWAMEQNTGSPAAKLVLVKLADNAGEDGLCWPSIDLIVKHTELAQSTVYKHLASLEDMGLVAEVERLAGRAGDAVIKAYQLNIPQRNDIPPHRKPDEPIPPRGISFPPRGKSLPPHGKTIPSGGIAYIAELSIEPSEEPSLEPRARVVQREMLLPILSGPTPDAFAAAIWPAFLTWPNLPANASEKRAREAWERCKPDLPDDDAMAKCALAHGQKLVADNERRGKLGFAPVVLPHNWIERDAGWQAYLPDVARVAAPIACALGTLTSSERERLARAGLTDAEIDAWFGDAEFHVQGSELTVSIAKPFARNWIANQFAARIERAWADVGVSTISVRLKAKAA